MSQPDPFEFMKSFFAKANVPGFASIPFSADEVDRKMAELRQVEGWLMMNLNLLKVQLQGLEAQKQMLGAFQSGQGFASGFGAAAASATSSPTASPTFTPAPSASAEPAVPPAAMMNPAAWMEAMQAHMKPFVDAATPKKATTASAKAAPKAAAKKSPRTKR
jgi:hypothetical protein